MPVSNVGPYIKIPMAEPIAPPIAPPPKHDMGGKKLFGGPKAPPTAPTGPSQQDILLLTTRLRVAEERYSDLRRKLQLVEQNMIMYHKKSIADNKRTQSDMLEIKRTIRAMEDKIIMAIKELQLTARKEDVDIMRRYVEMWNPVKFATIDQVEKIVDESLGKHHEEMHEE